MPTRLSTRITIVIPTYNSSTTLAQTLQSLLGQGDSLKAVDAVCIADDHSLDDTLGVVAATWNSSVPLQVVANKINYGERKNVNRAVELISHRSDWILILHSDDIAKPYWLETMLSRIETCDDRVASICSSWDNWWPDGTIDVGEDNAARPVEVIPGNEAAVRGTLMRGCWWHISGCAIRTKAFQSIGPFDPKMPQLGDWEWLLRCLAAGWSVEYVPRTLIRYRQSPASVSSLSHSVDLDIRESLAIVGRYSHLVSRAELLGWHGRRLGFCVRRLARPLGRLDLGRLYLGLQTIALVFLNYLRLRKTCTGRELGGAPC